jgi:hypothetical protein
VLAVTKGVHNTCQQFYVKEGIQENTSHYDDCEEFDGDVRFRSDFVGGVMVCLCVPHVPYVPFMVNEC